MIAAAELAEFREQLRRENLMVQYYFDAELPGGRKTYEELSRKFSIRSAHSRYVRVEGGTAMVGFGMVGDGN